MYKLTAANAFQDNYIWMLADRHDNAIIIDPGDANAVIFHLKQHNYKPNAILLTHYHADHIDGVQQLQTYFPFMPIYGPDEVIKKLSNCRIHCVNENSMINEIGLAIRTIFTPGHTHGHISYYTKPYLFCGDVLFSGGCGRVFEGSMNQMFDSLERLAGLDNKTLICGAHEYTLDNLKFAHALLPEDFQITRRLQEVELIRKEEGMTLPTTLALEKKINVFLRCSDSILKEKLNINEPNLVFAALRTLKNNFNSL